MAEWIRNGHKCSECGFILPHSAECYGQVEREEHGYQFMNYTVIPGECPICHSEMTAVVYEGGGKDG